MERLQHGRHRPGQSKGRPLSGLRVREGKTARPQTCLYLVPPVGSARCLVLQGTLRPGAKDTLSLSGHLVETVTEANGYIYGALPLS